MIKQKTKNKIFSIFIQKPPISLNNFDVVVSPKHDKCKGLNVIETEGALTKINSKYIKNINKKKPPKILKEKFISVLIGGDSRHHKITKSILINKQPSNYNMQFVHVLFVIANQQLMIKYLMI